MVGVPTVSRNPNEAWNFIQFLTNEQNSAAYALAAGRPSARIKLNANQAFLQAVNPQLKPFMEQVNFAQNWYRNEINQTDTVFKQAITAVLAGRPLTDVTNQLTKQVTLILRNLPYE